MGSRGPPGQVNAHLASSFFFCSGARLAETGAAPTAIVGGSGRGSRRATYPDAQGGETHLGVVAAAINERCNGSSEARGREGLQARVDMVLR